MTRRAWLLALLVWTARAAEAQEFATGAPAAEARTVHGLLEYGLATPSASGVESGVIRWFALPSLETRSLAAGVGVRSLRAAIGVAATGEAGLGWNLVAGAVGVTHPTFGVAARAAVRRDQEWASAPAGVLGRAVGAEAGAGAWMLAASHVRIWAAAPQTWRRGAAPPLARPLETGAHYEHDALAAWFTLRAPGAAGDGVRAVGVALAGDALRCWAEVLDAPLRASFGVRAERGPWECAVRLDAHPVLGETTRLSLGWHPRTQVEP